MRALLPGLALLPLIGCGSLSGSAPDEAMPTVVATPQAVDTGLADRKAGGRRMARGGAAQGFKEADAEPADEERRANRPRPAPSPRPAPEAVRQRAPVEAAQPEKPEPVEDAARVRTWFPEAFLWRPAVETDASGVATLDVRVPDQLTTWRILALAHDRAGHQSGAVHTFDSALPVSVDPVVPGWLHVGDRLVMPTQAQATTRPFVGRVDVRASGALVGVGGGSLDLAAGGSGVVPAFVEAVRSGEGLVIAELFAGTRVDGAERVIPVSPAGRPVTTQRGGVLSGPRTFPMDASGALEQRVVVRVFPGPLAALHAELDRIADAPPGAYAYALLDGVRALSATAGVEVDEAALRTLRIRAWQRLVRQARSPDPRSAAVLLHGLLAPQDELAATTRDRLVRVVEEGQRGDGTWSAADRSTLQEVLVQTAMAARSLPASSTGARLRAAGALERNRPQVEDPYTAAWLLASGVIDRSMRPELEAVVIAALEVGEDGRRSIVVPADVKDPFGSPPSRAEMLAVTALALAERTDLDWRGDLVSDLLQGWSAERGFGAGWADALALVAVRDGLATLDKPVRVVLEVDGVAVSSGQVDPSQPKVPALLEASQGGTVTVRAEPPVAGLAFVASHTAWLPYSGTERLPGVDVEVAQGRLVAGREGQVTLTLAAPSGARVTVTQGLPSGTVAEVPAETRAMLAGEPEIRQDRVVMRTRPFGAGEVMALTLDVTPTFAGRMGTRPLELEVAGRTVQLPPLSWTVDRGEGS